MSDDSGVDEAGGDDTQRKLRKPEMDMPIAGATEERYELFCDIREDVLIDHPHSTARAYWGDLDDLYLWAEERDKDVLKLTEKDVRQYLALLRRRHYSENTIRRRVTAFRQFYAKVGEMTGRADNPAKVVVVRRS